MFVYKGKLELFPTVCKCFSELYSHYAHIDLDTGINNDR